MLPNGTPQKMTIGDYRLHFYVLDLKRDKSGVLSYTVAIRSLDGAGAQRRGVRLSPSAGVAAPQRGWAKCTLPLTNTGTAGTAPYADGDVYRLSATGAAHLGTVKVTATSESDPTKKATTVCAVVG